MAKQGIVASGIVAFSKLTEHDVYNGKSTGNFTLTITLSDREAQRLQDMGVKVKEYVPAEGDPKLQRKFKTQYNAPVVDLDDRPVSGEIPFGSEVRVLWTAGEPSPEHGTPTYLQKVRVVEMAESNMEVPDEF